MRLIDRGHTLEHAEQWARETVARPYAKAEDLTAFAAALLGMWTYLEFSDPPPHRAALTAAARTWARHRLDATA